MLVQSGEQFPSLKMLNDTQHEDEYIALVEPGGQDSGSYYTISRIDGKKKKACSGEKELSEERSWNGYLRDIRDRLVERRRACIEYPWIWV